MSGVSPVHYFGEIEALTDELIPEMIFSHHNILSCTQTPVRVLPVFSTIEALLYVRRCCLVIVLPVFCFFELLNLLKNFKKKIK